MVLSWNQLLIQLGIIAFALTVVFQLATLPVEFNASGRALERLEHYGIVTAQENRGCRKVLGAAAMTYVAGTLAAVLQSAFDSAFWRRTPQGRLRVERQKEEGYG